MKGRAAAPAPTVKKPSGKNPHIGDIFEAFKKKTPHPTTELKYGNPYQLLVAVILSAQATDKGVNKATEALFKQVRTPAQMVALGEDGLTPFVKTIGLYRGKVKNVIATSRLLVEKHGGEVPRKREELEALPGVGRKTANVMLNTVYGEPVMAVDTHVYRVARRLGLSKGDTPLKVELDLVRNIPPEYMEHAHHWLILHGRYVCVARLPKCSECLVAKWCPRLGVEKSA
ncbi:MAG TPA: endonuclease III [Alphaproteobacteria bacterium]|nr:endonuclease III [Alphaproteobacteria bacterium]